MVTAIKILCILALKVPPHCLEITRNVSFEFLALAFSANFCRIKINLSGNTVWPQASGFQNWPFLTFLMNFCPCKRSSLRSHCWMRLFLWFSNTLSLIHSNFIRKSELTSSQLLIDWRFLGRLGKLLLLSSSVDYNFFSFPFSVFVRFPRFLGN